MALGRICSRSPRLEEEADLCVPLLVQQLRLLDIGDARSIKMYCEFLGRLLRLNHPRIMSSIDEGVLSKLAELLKSDNAEILEAALTFLLQVQQSTNDDVTGPLYSVLVERQSELLTHSHPRVR